MGDGGEEEEEEEGRRREKLDSMNHEAHPRRLSAKISPAGASSWPKGRPDGRRQAVRARRRYMSH